MKIKYFSLAEKIKSFCIFSKNVFEKICVFFKNSGSDRPYESVLGLRCLITMHDSATGHVCSILVWLLHTWNNYKLVKMPGIEYLLYNNIDGDIVFTRNH